MTITLRAIGKRFRYDWIFRDIDYTFAQGSRYAILGHNGSGKSTLLQVLSGHLTPSKGTIVYNDAAQDIAIDEIYTKISYAAPYIELIEEFTMTEAIDFHQKFKPLIAGFDTKKLIELLELPHNTAHKEIRFFSSGMKQRLKLALAICAETPMILLDEPTTNLDAQGIRWYRSLLDTHLHNRLFVVASNIEHDYDFCENRLSMLDYK